MKFTLARAARPRNPIVAAARFRQAGSHRAGGGSQRQAAQRTLARETADALRRRSSATPSDTHSP
ncbi:hypothetical protein [Piscinibacter sakaiensis]|uniref:Uncharacterized protein n=1 Tax=Piscinibacter sakaiensis TaxID=1547922 RepID=A0A0K8NZV2_PISS1|nr:hypothetical protein [Piscinibacter sakaiensis]GAP35814.1 hypothetical protein ISF6_1587 [Piscinibacter sakaiensis]